MNEKNQLGFIHKFIPSNKKERLEGREKVPTFLLLHGTGGNEEDLIPIGHEISSEAAILSPRGKVLEDGMPRFFRRLAEGVFDIEDLKFRTNELADFVKAASVRYGFESKPVVLVGYSNGANIAAGMLLAGSLLPAGALLFRPMVPLTPEELPNLKGMSVFISARGFDQDVPPG